MLAAKAHALITASDPILLDRREQIASFALQHKVLVMGFVQQIAAGRRPSELWSEHQLDVQTSRRLHRANPEEL